MNFYAMGDVDHDLALAIQLQEQFDQEFAHENVAVASSSDVIAVGGPTQAATDVYSRSDKPLSLVDPQWEVLDPSPDVRAMFMEFNDKYFWGRLAGVEVRWSPRMTLCAGVCSYEGRGGLCSVRLSEPLLKLRPRKDLVETLLHEMIHAYLFVTDNNKDHDGHGPEFHKHMYRLNNLTGTSISVYHTFHDEVDNYRQHWWRCDGPCQKWKPYFGYVRRATNRAPAPRDTWWKRHQQNCGGTFEKIKEPDGYGEKKAKEKKNETPAPEKPKAGPDIRTFFGSGTTGVKQSAGSASTGAKKPGSVGSTGSSGIKKPAISGTPASRSGSSGAGRPGPSQPTKPTSTITSGILTKTGSDGKSNIIKKPIDPFVKETKPTWTAVPDAVDKMPKLDESVKKTHFPGMGNQLGASIQNPPATRNVIVRRIPGIGIITNERPKASGYIGSGNTSPPERVMKYAAQLAPKPNSHSGVNPEEGISSADTSSKKAEPKALPPARLELDSGEEPPAVKLEPESVDLHRVKSELKVEGEEQLDLSKEKKFCLTPQELKTLLGESDFENDLGPPKTETQFVKPCASKTPKPKQTPRFMSVSNRLANFKNMSTKTFKSPDMALPKMKKSKGDCNVHKIDVDPRWFGDGKDVKPKAPWFDTATQRNTPQDWKAHSSQVKSESLWTSHTTVPGAQSPWVKSESVKPSPPFQNSQPSYSYSGASTLASSNSTQRTSIKSEPIDKSSFSPSSKFNFNKSPIWSNAKVGSCYDGDRVVWQSNSGGSKHGKSMSSSATFGSSKRFSSQGHSFNSDRVESLFSSSDDELPDLPVPFRLDLPKGDGSSSETKVEKNEHSAIKQALESVEKDLGIKATPPRQPGIPNRSPVTKDTYSSAETVKIKSRIGDEGRPCVNNPNVVNGSKASNIRPTINGKSNVRVIKENGSSSPICVSTSKPSKIVFTVNGQERVVKIDPSKSNFIGENGQMRVINVKSAQVGSLSKLMIKSTSDMASAGSVAATYTDIMNQMKAAHASASSTSTSFANPAPRESDISSLDTLKMKPLSQSNTVSSLSSSISNLPSHTTTPINKSMEPSYSVSSGSKKDEFLKSAKSKALGTEKQLSQASASASATPKIPVINYSANRNKRALGQSDSDDSTDDEDLQPLRKRLSLAGDSPILSRSRNTSLSLVGDSPIHSRNTSMSSPSDASPVTHLVPRKNNMPVTSAQLPSRSTKMVTDRSVSSTGSTDITKPDQWRFFRIPKRSSSESSHEVTKPTLPPSGHRRPGYGEASGDTSRSKALVASSDSFLKSPSSSLKSLPSSKKARMSGGSTDKSAVEVPFVAVASQSSGQDSTETTKDHLLPCPVCQKMVRVSLMNPHLDVCLFLKS